MAPATATEVLSGFEVTAVSVMLAGISVLVEEEVTMKYFESSTIK